MRNQERSKRTSTAIALAVGILMATFALPAHAVCPAVVVLNTSVVSGGVNVTVRNTSILPQTRTVGVQVVMGDTAVWSYVLVTLLPYQTTTVKASVTGVVSSVMNVGFTDDPSPY
jgi:hypothetical protein